MRVNNTFSAGVLTLSNFSASGAIGTAAATVDNYATIYIGQTTNGVVLTIPAPTITDAGARLRVHNSGTVPVTVGGEFLMPTLFLEFEFDGTVWRVFNYRNRGAVVTLSIISTGNNTVTHNLNMPSGRFSYVIERAFNLTGNEVIFRRVTGSDTANAIVVNSTVDLTDITFYITPLV